MHLLLESYYKTYYIILVQKIDRAVITIQITINK